MLQQRGQKIADNTTQTTQQSSHEQVEQPYINKIIESTKQIINNQAMKIFQLSNEVKMLRKQNQILRNKYQILLRYQSYEQLGRGQDGREEGEANKKIDIDGIIEKVGGLESQLVIAKMELAQCKAQILQLKFQGMKTQKLSTSSTSTQLLNISEIKKLKSTLQQASKVQKGEEALVISQWQKLCENYLEGYPRISRFKDKTAELVKKGIPYSLRQTVWPVIFENKVGITSALYSQLLTRRYKDEGYSKKVVSQINKDICRSFNGKTQFDSKVGLNIEVTEILEVFHIYRPDVSYVQGMTYPAIVLNLIVGKYKAFAIFCNLILGNQFFRRLYTFQEAYLNCYCRAFQMLLEEKLPKVAKLLSQKGVQSQIYLVQWFYTFFSRGLSYQFTLKIWDNLAYQQQLLFYKLGLSIFQLIEDALLSSDEPEPTAIIREFCNYLTQPRLQQALLSQKLTAQKLERTFEKVVRARRQQKLQ